MNSLGRLTLLAWCCGLLVCGCSMPAGNPGQNSDSNANNNGDGMGTDNTNANGGAGSAPECSADGTCNVTCFMDLNLSPDPDCTNEAICTLTGGLDNDGFCCSPDSNCDTDCPEPDPECEQIGIQDGMLCANFCASSMDGSCTDGGAGSVGSGCDFGTDCADCGPRDMEDASDNDLECFVSGFCCTGDMFCDLNCTEPDPDCGS